MINVPAADASTIGAQRILVVDDLDANRLALGALVEALGYEIETARDGLEALAKLEMGVDLVLLDLLMPGLDGYEVTRRIREHPDHRDLPVIVVTALDSRDDRLRAVQAGANDFIAKPIDRTELLVRLKAHLRVKEASDAVKSSQARLEEQVSRRTAALRRALEATAEAQRKTYEAHIDTIQRLVLAAECKDRFTSEHIQRISWYGELLAKSLHLPPGEVEILRHAITMHDVGKIGIPDAILLKKGALTPEEREVMKGHTWIGARILSGSKSPLLQAGEVIALSHHERWDGTGYPRRLSGEAIPLESRICALADVFDALTSDRPYRPALEDQKVFDMMKAERETHFDPALFDLFAARFEDFVKIRQSSAESPPAGLAVGAEPLSAGRD
jgi:putative two-component system response regulator